jgi:hypothetical protein
MRNIAEREYARQLDIASLPWVWLKDRNNLPESAGLYAVCRMENERPVPIYFGMSRNMRKRHCTYFHHRESRFQAIDAKERANARNEATEEALDEKLVSNGGLRVYYDRVLVGNPVELERYCIRHFQPILNVVDKISYLSNFDMTIHDPDCFPELQLSQKIEEMVAEESSSGFSAAFNHRLRVLTSRMGEGRAVRGDWELDSSEMLLDYGDATCLCGHEIKEVYWFSNPVDLNRIRVGSSCVDKFFENGEIIVGAASKIHKKTSWDWTSTAESQLVKLLASCCSDGAEMPDYLESFKIATQRPKTSQLITSRTAKRFAVFTAWLASESTPGSLPDEFKGKILADASVRDFGPDQLSRLVEWAAEVTNANFRILSHHRQKLKPPIFFSASDKEEVYIESIAGEKIIGAKWNKNRAFAAMVKSIPLVTGQTRGTYIPIKHSELLDLGIEVVGEEGDTHYHFNFSDKVKALIQDRVHKTSKLSPATSLGLSGTQLNEANRILSKLDAAGHRIISKNLTNSILGHVKSDRKCSSFPYEDWPAPADSPPPPPSSQSH